jgi:hypothetical protein
MPMIDVYAEAGTISEQSFRALGHELTHAVLRAEGVLSQGHFI